MTDTPQNKVVARDIFTVNAKDSTRKEVLVSTINRQSSSIYGDWYAETFVFELDDQGRLSKLLDQGEAAVDSMVTHNRLLREWGGGYE